MRCHPPLPALTATAILPAVSINGPFHSGGLEQRQGWLGWHRAINGGLMDLRALQRYVERRRGLAAEPISRDDIMQAIKKLRVLGGGFRVLKLGDQRLVASLPKELNTDKNRVLELAQVSNLGLPNDGHTLVDSVHLPGHHTLLCIACIASSPPHEMSCH